MLRSRIIPILLVRNNGLVKTLNFSNDAYVGDPLNAVRIFNEKEADEITILDIQATNNESEPDYNFLKDIVSEAFMPVGYGGGVKNLNQIEKLFEIGIEKVILNTVCFENPSIVAESSDKFGSQSIVVCIDIQKNLFKIIKSQEFIKFKNIKPRNVSDIHKLNNYVRLKILKKVYK